MLEKAVPRHAGETVKRGSADATRLEDQEKKLTQYGQRLYDLMFGDGADLRSFLKFNDPYQPQARLTLALHGNAATLWRLPWEYLHDEKDFMALTGRLLLSRVLHGLGRLNPAAAAPPLRILVVVSAPDDQRPLDTLPITTPPWPCSSTGCWAARWRGLCVFTGRYRWDAFGVASAVCPTRG